MMGAGAITDKAVVMIELRARFRGVTAARVRYLTDSEIKRLVIASAVPFRALVTGAILTCARYGELAALRASDFDARGGTVHIRQSKAGHGLVLRVSMSALPPKADINDGCD